MLNSDSQYNYKFAAILSMMLLLVGIFTLEVSLKRAQNRGYNSGYHEGYIEGKIETVQYVDSLVDTVRLNSVEVKRIRDGLSFNWEVSHK